MLALGLLQTDTVSCEASLPVFYCTGSNVPPDDGLDAGVATAALFGGQPAIDRLSTVRVSGEYGCTGVVLSPHTVLTAAHCVKENQETIVTSEDCGCWYSGSALRHPDYREWAANGDLEARKADIALVFFDDVELPGPYIESFYFGRAESENCKRVFIQGYGTDGQPGTILNEGEFFVFDEEPKVIRYSGMTNETTCHGDSGGPVYVEMNDGEIKLAAIHVWHSRSDCMGYSTGIRVDYWRKWIITNAHW